MGIYIFWGCPQWLMTDSPVLRALVYPLFHANVFHLLCNSLALWTMFRGHRQHALFELIVGYIISCIVFPLATRPVVGISNLLFAVIGMRTPPFSMTRYWKNPTIITFYAANVIALLIPGISAVTHLAALALGITVAHIGRTLMTSHAECR